jgi:hypothetical protein
MDNDWARTEDGRWRRDYGCGITAEVRRVRLTHDRDGVWARVLWRPGHPPLRPNGRGGHFRYEEDAMAHVDTLAHGVTDAR